MTIQELLRASLRAIGAINPGVTPTDAELQDALEALNMMLDNWMTDIGVVYAGIEENFTLTSSDAEYTIGSGGDFDTTRPYNILGAFIRESGTDYPVEVVSESEYNRISSKAQTGRPYKINYLPENPLGKIRLFPTPGSAYDLHIQAQKPLANFTSLAATITLPPGYLNAIKWNLCLELAPEWDDSTVSPLILKGAQEGFDRIVNLNAARRAESVKLNLFTKSGRYDFNIDTYI